MEIVRSVFAKTSCRASRIARSQGTIFKLVCIVFFTSVLASCNGSNSSSDGSSLQDDFTENYLPLSELAGASFNATRLSIVSGESSVLVWSVEEAVNVRLEPLSESVDLAGEQSVSPTENSKYLLLVEVAGSSQLYGKSISITVREVAAVTLLANVEKGSAPLTVRFTPSVSSVTNISRYYWDFEGDGGPQDGGLGIGSLGFDTLSIRTGGFTLDEYDTIGRPLTFTFEQAGTYTTRVRVWDDDGNQADATITVVVENTPPEIDKLFLSSATSAGQVPLRVSLDVSAIDADGVQSIEWDLDGDGTFDTTSEVREVRGVFISKLQTVYETAGVFRPSVRVTDLTGLSTTTAAPSIRVDASVNPIPLVSAIGSIGGNAPFAASFSVRISDPGRSGLTSLAIDYNGDGDFDALLDSTQFSTSYSVAHTYESPGIFYLYMEVTAEDGSVGKRYVEVIVEANHTLSVSKNMLDPLTDEVATIDVELGGTSVSEIVIIDENGQPIDVIGAEQQRDSGTYSFSWDGRNLAGDIAAPGIYFALLNYKIGDDENVLDLRDEHTVSNYYPGIRVSGIDLQAGTQPFANKPIEYPFALTRFGLNRLTAYMTQRGSDVLTSSASIFRARYVADGDYIIKWLGDGTTGKLLPLVENSNDFYVPGVIAESVADNGILLTHATSIEDISLEEPIFHPSLVNDRKNSEISFTLSHPSTIQLTVASTDSGAEVLRKEFANVPAGNASVNWDGRDNAGNLLAPAGYRLQLVAFGPYGDTSLPAAIMQRIRY